VTRFNRVLGFFAFVSRPTSFLASDTASVFLCYLCFRPINLHCRHRPESYVFILSSLSGLFFRVRH